MFVKRFDVGGDRNFAYLVENNGEAIVIDPSFSPEKIIAFAADHKYKIKYIFNTHGHFDHSNGNEIIEKLTGLQVLSFTDLNDGDKFPLGNLEITILHTPGHTTDSICLYVGDMLFTGDTLFVGKVGGTGFGDDARAEYNSLHNKLLKLPDETRVFPGHNYGVAVESTIGHERKTNPFLLRGDFESFVDLKRNWAEYKKQHGIK